MMPDIGSLDRRVSFARPNGGSYDVLGSTWAARLDMKDADKQQFGWTLSARSARFIVRSSTLTRSLKSTDAMSHNGKLWNVEAIKETRDGRNRFLEITAREVN